MLNLHKYYIIKRDKRKTLFFLDKMILLWYHYNNTKMRLITRNTDYAIRALRFIARNDKRKETIPVCELARNLNIPKPFLRKILQVLNKKGILKSYKGKGGGFMLAVPPKRIFLIKVIEIFQGPLKLNGCILNKSLCPDMRSCVLKKKIGAIEKNVVSELESITLASLLEEER